VTDRSPGWFGVSRWFKKTLGIFRDEYFIDVASGTLAGMDVIALKFGGEAVLEGAVEAFAAAAGLWASGEDKVDGEVVHSLLEVGGWRGLALFFGEMVGGDEMTGAVEVESSGQAESAKDVITDLEATVSVFLGLELAGQGSAGGVIAGQQETDGGIVLPEPWVGRAVEEEQLTFAGVSRASAAMNAGFAEWFTVSQWAEGFVGDDKAVFLRESIGQVGEVIIGVGRGGHVDDLLADGWRFGIGRRSACIAVQDAGWAGGLHLNFKALDLPDGQVQSGGTLSIGEPPFQDGLEDLEALCLFHGQSHLWFVHTVSPDKKETALYCLGVTKSLWR
jgi:hypothetical protein